MIISFCKFTFHRFSSKSVMFYRNAYHTPLFLNADIYNTGSACQSSGHVRHEVKLFV